LREAVLIEKLEERANAGPQPAFSKYDILKALEVMYSSGPLGRKKLAITLHLGEGSTRTMIDHLQTESLVVKTRYGCELTGKGRKVAHKLLRKIVKHTQLPENPLVPGRFAYGILVRKCASKIRNGLEQRDAAIRAGAKSATTIVCRGSRLVMPPETGLSMREWEEPLRMVQSRFEPQNDDVIILSGADGLILAELGARAASWTLLRD
jgi:hypothetical protein